jgi:hypothetical protein
VIRPLRQRHRHMVIALGLVLPVAFAAGIAARRPAPTVAALPPRLVVAPQHFEAVEWESAGLFPKSPLQTRLLRQRKDTGLFAIAFTADRHFVKPDLIVYWAAGNPKVAQKLPDNVALLGSFTPCVALSLPKDAFPAGGVLVLYSLADQEIVDVSKPLTLQKP